MTDQEHANRIADILAPPRYVAVPRGGCGTFWRHWAIWDNELLMWHSPLLQFDFAEPAQAEADKLNGRS